MNGAYFNVSGVDQSEDARTIFVRYRNENPGSDILLGSGRVVGKGLLLPGIQVGQFSITFLLPDGCSADRIVVSRDKSGTELLSDVTLIRCLIDADACSGGTIIPDNPPMRTGPTNVAGNFTDCGRILTVQKMGSAS